MNQRVRAYYLKGVFTPLEPLELAEGTEVDLEISMALFPGPSGEIRIAR